MSTGGRRIQVATDGSRVGAVRSGKGGAVGPGGWAWYRDEAHYGFGSARSTTNNAMELTAIYEAIVANPGRLEIISDSRYAINAVSTWWPAWQRRGWMTASRTPVQNADLIKRIVAAKRDRDVVFTWVRGHDGHELNQMADHWATRAAAQQLTGPPTLGGVT